MPKSFSQCAVRAPKLAQRCANSFTIVSWPSTCTGRAAGSALKVTPLMLTDADRDCIFTGSSPGFLAFPALFAAPRVFAMAKVEAFDVFACLQPFAAAIHHDAPQFHD